MNTSVVKICSDVFKSISFISASPIERATWISVLLYAHSRGDSYIIKDCGWWSDRQWLSLCGVTLDEVKADNQLFSFIGSDLIISGKQNSNGRLDHLVRKDEEKDESCFVYLMKTHHSSSVKIGISNNPKVRERTLRADDDVYLYDSIKFDSREEARCTESLMHDHYSEYRSRGEWFTLTNKETSKGIGNMIKEAKSKKNKEADNV